MATICMQALNEVRVLAGLRHPNVVRYYESFDKTFINGKDRLMIVMELCDVSALFQPLLSP